MKPQMLPHGHLGAPNRRRVLLATLAAAACLALAALVPASASAANPPGTFGPPVPACPSSTPNWCVASFTASTTNADGTADTQAGSHPFESVTSFDFSVDAAGVPTENMKDVSVNLPPGLVGDPNAVPKCTVGELDTDSCPVDSQIGTLVLDATVTLFPNGTPVYNMVPPTGVAAEFGTNLLLIDAFIDVKVRTGGDYGLTAGLSNTSTLLPLFGSTLTLWGVPGDSGHDNVRTCPGGVTPCPAGGGTKPFLTMPTQCGSLHYSLSGDSWQGDSANATFDDPNPITGCDTLSFNPSIKVGIGPSSADSPSAVSVDVHVPQAPDSATSLATPSLKSAVVTLPQGIQLSPSAANGLQACTEAQFGPNTSAEPACPNASKIGTAEIDSPISADPLTGGIWLAQQNANPFGSTFAIYVATEADGTLIKLSAKIVANPVTGQLTTTFDGTPAFPGNPQLPFSDFKLNFFGGSGAALMTGEQCGTFNGSTRHRAVVVTRVGSGLESGPDGHDQRSVRWRVLADLRGRQLQRAGGGIRSVRADVLATRYQSGSVWSDGHVAAGYLGEAGWCAALFGGGHCCGADLLPARPSLRPRVAPGAARLGRRRPTQGRAPHRHPCRARCF